MTTNSLSKSVLVLNKGWTAIRVISVKRALILTFAEKAVIVDAYADFSVYNWEEWSKLPIKENEDFISTSNEPIRIPEIIVLSNYDKIHDRTLRLTKKNLFLRDGHVCQYTGRKLSSSEADIDHVKPKSRGGANDWNNMVVCSKTINRKKGNKTPEEAGLTLIRQPKKPSSLKLLIDPRKKSPESWKHFLKE